MIKLDSQNKVVITGAGGWLGRELLEVLLAEFGPNELTKSVICLGSRERLLNLSDGTNIPVYSMTDQLDAENVAGFVHLAFLTRDKVETYGTKDYTFRNLGITSRAIELIEQLKPSWIATVSSGAVLSSPGGPLENNLERNPYGFTKRIEETMLRQVAQQIDAHLSIGRLWGAMGSFMPVNRAYAVSDFIVQAITTGSISIKADRQVWRRYCDAGEFMNVLVSTAQTYPETQFDSGGNLIEVGDLADAIANALKTNLKITRPEIIGEPDQYFPPEELFNMLRKELGIETQSLLSKVLSTIESHRRQLNR